MERILQAAILVLLAVIIVLALYVAYLLIRRNMFTRERYAFAALWGNSTAFVAVLVSVMAPEPIWQSAMNIFAELSALSYRSPPATASDKILAVVLYCIFNYSTWQLFRHWPGARSERQEEQDQRQERPSLIREGIYETARLVSRRPSAPLAKGHRYKGVSRISPPTESLAWRERARELAELLRQDLRYEESNNWHADHSMWVGQHRHTGSLIGVWCVEEFHDALQAETRVMYLKALAGSGGTCELMILAQDKCSGSLTIDGVNVNTFTEQEALDKIVDFTDYFRHIAGRVENECLPDSDLTIDDVYVPSQVRLGPSRKDAVVAEDLVSYLEEWHDESGQRQLAVLGTYGQGKSTSMMVFARDAVRRIKAGERVRIPIFIELRGKSPATLTSLELLAHWTSLYGIDPRAMLILLKSGRLTIILDGFDEMAESGTAEARVAHFTSLWQLCYPRAKIVFTGRPHFLLDDAEIKAALGVGEPDGSGAYCEAIHLAPFDRARVISSLRNVTEATKEGILALADRSGRFQDIVTRPSLLYAVTRIWNLPEVQSHHDNLNSAGILSLFIKHSYRRQSEKQRDQRSFMAMTEAERAYFMLGVAAYMAHNGESNQITKAELETVVGRLYQNIPNSLPAETLALPGDTPRASLKERMSDDGDALEKIITNVRTYGILESDPSRQGTYRFGHKSFFEVLFSQYLKECLFAPTAKMTGAIKLSTGAAFSDYVNVPFSLKMTYELTASVGFNTKDEIDEYFYKGNLNQIVMARFFCKMRDLTAAISRINDTLRPRATRHSQPNTPADNHLYITSVGGIFSRVLAAIITAYPAEVKAIFWHDLRRQIEANPVCQPNPP
ncbi:MAG: NACHT domain-containing protein [Rhodospirillaceae bacterium]|nr:NACHT domain-containing protein [Rhodospirillales bacterium]